MENKYEVTIGIPVYNVEKYIRLTMESLLSQTFPSIEFIFCDDCGKDASVDIIRDYQQNHPRGKDIRIVRQPQNMGIGAARNRMIAEASGRYFYSLDADDAIESNTIELLYNNAKKYQAEIVYGSYKRVFQEDDKTVRTVSFPYPFRVFTKEDEYADYVYNVGVQGMNWNYLIDLDIIRRNNLKVTPVGHGYGEDFTFTIDLPTYITRAVLLPDITYHYYIRGIDKHKCKKVLKRKDMTIALAALDEKKRRTELQHKGYYSKRISILMMFDHSFASEMVAKRADFDMPFTNKEIRDVMWHPMSLWQILKAKPGRLRNLLYYTYGKLPPNIFVLLLRVMRNRNID